MLAKFKLRRGTQAEWAATNPVLSAGEPGFETDTFRGKIGNGVAAWVDLPYYLNEDQIADLIAAAIEDAELVGVPGPAGPSAYDVAVENGFVGDEEEWLESLQGADGVNGTNGTNGVNGVDGQDGVDGAEGQSAYEVAVEQGFVGNEAAWLASLIGPPGEDGVDGTNGEDGAEGPPGPSSEVYPISSYGFVAVSMNIEAARLATGFGNWVTRVWVPAGKAIAKVGVYVTGTGVTGSGLNSFAVYSDAGDLLQSTPTDNDLWTSEGWTIRSLSSPIAAEGSGRFVRVAVALNGSSPNVLYASHDGPSTVYNGGDISHRRAYAVGSRGSWPSTINPATEGDDYPYLPLVVLA